MFQLNLADHLSDCFFPPTLIKVSSHENYLWQDEVFGPVLSFMTFDSDQEALELANTSSFGLGASIWSSSKKRQAFFVNYIEAGMIAINNMLLSTYDRPFGGIKHSGYGKELAREGLLSFVNQNR